MSYKYTVLKDNPLSFFLLDEVSSGTAGVYSNLTSLFSTYADLRDNGISYAAVSGLPIKDYSGNGMEGYELMRLRWKCCLLLGRELEAQK